MTVNDAAGVEEKPVRYDCLILDLDDTLYPLSSGLAEACRINIESYMIEFLGIDADLVPGMCSRMYMHYGTTMAGLWAEGYYFDHDHFHSYVHGRLPYENLRPDPVLRNLLQSMPQRKVIFTNADKTHADICLKNLGVEDCFDSIICFETFNRHCAIAKDQKTGGQIVKLDTRVPILCKPSVECIREAVQLLQVDPSKALYFDDSARNIKAGKAVGLRTVLVGSSFPCEGADHTIGNLHNVRESNPEIWAEPHYFDELRLPPQKIAVESIA